MIAAPIIIIGSGRSGSSLLNAVLGGHPDIMMLGEMRFMLARVWDALWGCDGNSVQRGLRDRFSADIEHGRVCAEVSDSYKRVATDLKSAEFERTARILRRTLDDWFCISCSGKRHWGFKEIWNGGAFDVDWAAYDRVFPEAVWVHIVRNPLSVAVSCAQSSGRALDHPFLFELLLQWKKTIEKSRPRRSGGRLFEIRYEDLCARPREVLGPLFSAIGLRWDDRCNEALRRQHGPKSPSADGSWPDMRDLAAEIGLAGLMQELGYADPPQLAATAPCRASSSGVGQNPVAATVSKSAPNHSLVQIGDAPWLLRAPFPRESGNGWEFALPLDCGIDFGLFSDDIDQWTRSPLEIFEDGRPLGPAHALHEYIRVLGGGSYSHWRDRLLFSSSDNSDPNVNGREYSIRLPKTLWTTGAG
jgi:Sulfotransferase family